jgi:hypothetical protein
MKAYIVLLPQIPESVAVAARCAQSAVEHGLTPVSRSGVWRDDARAEMAAEGLTQAAFDQVYSNPDAVIGNFVAQYRIWQEIAQAAEPALIMEHDAVVVAPVPAMPDDAHIVNLGKPSFGKVPPPRAAGLYPLFSRRNKLPGAHGYYLTPRGAAQLAKAATMHGVMPVDLFVCPQRFPNTLEYYPWPIEAHDSFTTIQKRRGCIAKHNYRNGDYRIL